MIRILRPLLLATLACSAAPASAQTMYRCGNAFQDHPCAGGQAGQAIGTAASPDSARTSTAPKLSAECAQRGIAAQKIKWMREAGRTQQDQVAAAGGDQQELIADVYRRQGTSVQVRSAIEEDCMAEQERNAQADALLKAANRSKAGSGATGSTGNSAAAAASAATPPAGDTSAQNAAANKKATCQQLRSQLDGVRAQQRAGGSLGSMEALRQQNTDIGTRLRTTGC